MARHICLVLISPLGELTSMVCFMFAIGRLCFATKLDVMNECDAPESNKTIVFVQTQALKLIMPQCHTCRVMVKWSAQTT
jgi:hypothetical protein